MFRSQLRSCPNSALAEARSFWLSNLNLPTQAPARHCLLTYFHGSQCPLKPSQTLSQTIMSHCQRIIYALTAKPLPNSCQATVQTVTITESLFLLNPHRYYLPIRRNLSCKHSCHHVYNDSGSKAGACGERSSSSFSRSNHLFIEPCLIPRL